MLSGEVKKPDGYCAACRKHFNTEGAFENHLKSKKHRESAAAFDKRKDKVVQIGHCTFTDSLRGDTSGW